MDILTAMTDENDGISASDERRLNVNNLGHEWYTRAYVCQTLLDATGDSTSSDISIPREHRNNTSTENLRFRSSPI